MIISKKNMTLIIFLSLNYFFCVDGMEKNNAGKMYEKMHLEPMYGTFGPTVKYSHSRVNKELRFELSKELIKHFSFSSEQLRKPSQIFIYGHTPTNGLVTHHDNPVEDINEQCKKTIKGMIEYKDIHPNNIFCKHIIYSNRYQPYEFINYSLLEGMTYGDINFIAYLLTHGARPTPKDLKLTGSNFGYKYNEVQRNNELRKLFLQYSIMFYKKNKDNDIFPFWHHDDPVQQIATSLSHLIDSIKPEEYEKIYFVMDVPHEKKEILDEIKKIGFNIHFSDDKMTQLIYKKAYILEVD